MPKVGRREEILNVACKLFSKKGFHGTKIRDVSNACGLLAGSLYAHINTKEDLLYEIADRGAEAFLSSLHPIAKRNLPAAEKLYLGLLAHIKVIENNLDAATVFFHDWKALTEERRHKIQCKRDEYEQLWSDILHEGMKKGELVTRDMKFAKLLILSVGNWLYEWYRPDGECSAEEIASRFAKMILRGFCCKEGG